MIVTRNYARIQGSLRELYPDLANEFNETKTGRAAETVLPGSSVKAWWTCKENHTYQAPVARRALSGSGCPYCSNTKVLSGFNDLGTFNPDIASQLDEQKSGFSAAEVMGKSSKPAWWKCKAGHSWKATISSRSSNGRGCPFCSGRKTLPEKSIAVLYPEIAKWLDEDKSGITAFEVPPISHKNLWWFCEHGHSYQQMAQNKTRQNDGCPVCSGRYASAENSLRSVHPEMAKEFDASKNGFSADSITAGSKIAVWWKCPAYGHEWKVSPASRNRTVQGNRKTNHISKKIAGKDSGCPFCANFSVLKGFNDFATVNPKLAKEFDAVKTGYGADTFTSGSSRIVFWKCSHSHSWEASVNARALRGQGCPECSGANSSKIEVAFRKGLAKIQGWDVADESNTKVVLTNPAKKRLMVDIKATVGSKKVIVEYDGYYYHSGAFKNDRAIRFARDIDKTELLLSNGYYVVRIRERNINGRLDFLNISHVRLFQIEHEYKGQKVDHSNFIQETLGRIDKWIQSM